MTEDLPGPEPRTSQRVLHIAAIGEVLWDIFPTGPRFGGAPANFACTSAQLAGDSAALSLVSAVGDDELGHQALEALRKHGVTADIDVHLMVKPVDRIIPDFAAAGASYITFHPEASEHVDRSLQLIKAEGCKAGLVFNPATPLDILEYVMDKVDLILLMSVNPGFGGQSFIDSALTKLRQARKLIEASGRDIRLEIDGGVKVDNIREIAEAGADMFVAGSAIFGAANEADPHHYETVVSAMRAELAKAG